MDASKAEADEVNGCLTDQHSADHHVDQLFYCCIGITFQHMPDDLRAELLRSGPRQCAECGPEGLQTLLLGEGLLKGWPCFPSRLVNMSWA